MDFASFCQRHFCTHCLEDHSFCEARAKLAPKLKPQRKLVDRAWAADEPGTHIQDRAVVLFLPPYEVEEDIEDWCIRLPAYCTPLFGKKMHLIRSEPPLSG